MPTTIYFKTSNKKTLIKLNNLLRKNALFRNFPPEVVPCWPEQNLRTTNLFAGYIYPVLGTQCGRKTRLTTARVETHFRRYIHLLHFSKVSSRKWNKIVTRKSHGKNITLRIDITRERIRASFPSTNHKCESHEGYALYIVSESARENYATTVKILEDTLKQIEFTRFGVTDGFV